MTASLIIPIVRQRLLKPANLFALAYVFVGITVLQNYLAVGSVNFLLGLFALPFVCKADPAFQGGQRYGWIAVCWLVLCFLMPVKTLFYFTLGSAFLFFIESFYGRTSFVAFLVLVFASPVFQYLGDTFSFPIRLQMTKMAGQLLNWFGSSVEVRGNVIIRGAHEFSVDPACMGLKMISASLLCATMLLGFYQQKFNRQARTWTMLLFLAAIFLLNIPGNLFRILLLVQFNLQPETTSHDLAGLGCLLVYVLIPAVLMSKWLVKRSLEIPGSKLAVFQSGSGKRILMHLLLVTAMIFLGMKVQRTDTFSRFRIPGDVKGYSITNPKDGIVKLYKPGTLIYIKYIRGFYDTEHNPMLCWTGGGYRFTDVAIEKMAGRSVYTGVIKNDEEKFYSAWWYDNGTKSTTDQLVWRWDLLNGANHYVLVNISCSDKQILTTEIQRLINQKTLDPFFK